MKKIIILYLFIILITISSCRTSSSFSTSSLENSTYDQSYNLNTYFDFKTSKVGAKFTLKCIVVRASVYNNSIKNLEVNIDGNLVSFTDFSCTKEQSEKLSPMTEFIAYGEKKLNGETPILVDGKLIEILGVKSEYKSTGNLTKDVTLSSDFAYYNGSLGLIRILKDGIYNEKLNVALYIYIFKKLPSNYYSSSTYQSNFEERLVSIGGNTYVSTSSFLEDNVVYKKAEVDRNIPLSAFEYIPSESFLVYKEDFTEVLFTDDGGKNFALISFNS